MNIWTAFIDSIKLFVIIVRTSHYIIYLLTMCISVFTYKAPYLKLLYIFMKASGIKSFNSYNALGNKYGRSACHPVPLTYACTIRPLPHHTKIGYCHHSRSPEYIPMTGMDPEKNNHSCIRVFNPC